MRICSVTTVAYIWMLDVHINVQDIVDPNTLPSLVGAQPKKEIPKRWKTKENAIDQASGRRNRKNEAS